MFCDLAVKTPEKKINLNLFLYSTALSKVFTPNFSYVFCCSQLHVVINSIVTIQITRGKMNRVEVKTKLKGIIRSMLLSDLETESEIPDSIAHEILKSYGCTIGEKSNEKDCLDVFLKKLQKWIEDNHQEVEESNTKDSEEIDFDNSIYKQYLQAEKEYCEVTSEICKVLEDVVKQKEVHSKYFKDECSAQETNLEVLGKKCQFLKHQFFLKLYGEENALKGHLELKAKLKEELEALKKKYSEVVEYNKQMSEIKNDKTFCELFKVYKELKKVEQMMEIITTI